MTITGPKTDGPSGRVTVLIALLEVEQQFYGENTLTLTERNRTSAQYMM